MKMNVRHKTGILLLLVISLGFGQAVLADDYTDDINLADKKVILEQYEEAIAIYKDIIQSSGSSIIKAYAHYKLGMLYKRRGDFLVSKSEYEKGMATLKKSGQSSHKIGVFLAKALKSAG